MALANSHVQRLKDMYQESSEGWELHVIIKALARELKKKNGFLKCVYM